MKTWVEEEPWGVVVGSAFELLLSAWFKDGEVQDRFVPVQIVDDETLELSD